MSVSSPPGVGLLPPADNQRAWDELRARPAVAYPVNSVHATQTLIDGMCIFLGWAFRETAAAAGSFDFYNGRDTTGTQAGSGVISASGGNAQQLGDQGILCGTGLTLVVTSSTLKGSIWVRV